MRKIVVRDKSIAMYLMYIKAFMIGKRFEEIAVRK